MKTSTDINTIEFNSILLDLKQNLENFAFSLTRNREDALDLVQETYLKALNNAEKFEKNTNLRAWVFTIMKNIFINNYRRNQKRSLITDSSNYSLANYKQEVYANPESNVSHCEISNKIDQLDVTFKVPFQMHIEGYKYEEIAQKLKINIGTVKSRIFLSRKKLMGTLLDYQFS